ncbi:hypothetical protein L3X38_036173 [Prunus dulcis]|uniref:Uncharacterized protein n=1 Tax=Prunus dulcis TaxID=3755 RepID=A0AAD4V2C7_PRUDU|nr:hypothetical protein L3X38_036173 [Prunus dulcis]
MEISRKGLEPAATPLLGFTGDIIHSIGSITLPLSLGTTPQQTTVYITFLIVESSLAYNVILARLALCSIQALIASHMPLMKFPIKASVGYVRGGQQKARKYYVVVAKQKGKERLRMYVIERDRTDFSIKLNQMKLNLDLLDEWRDQA